MKLNFIGLENMVDKYLSFRFFNKKSCNLRYSRILSFVNNKPVFLQNNFYGIMIKNVKANVKKNSKM